jgi:signal transduction histidine kinase
LKRLVAQFIKHGRCQVVSRIEDIDRLLPRDAEINLYRVFQEALTNIGRHAGAGNVTVVVERQDRKIYCQVEDDGRGFDPTPRPADSAGRGMGLAIMRERVRMLGASLEIESQEGKGTRISFSIPIGKTGGG